MHYALFECSSCIWLVHYIYQISVVLNLSVLVGISFANIRCIQCQLFCSLENGILELAHCSMRWRYDA